MSDTGRQHSSPGLRQHSSRLLVGEGLRASAGFDGTSTLKSLHSVNSFVNQTVMVAPGSSYKTDQLTCELPQSINFDENVDG